MNTAHWVETTLGDIAEVVGGATPKTSVDDYWDGDIPWATPKDLSVLEGASIASTPRSLTEAGLRNCSAQVLPPNSVLLSSRAPIGHVAINTVPMATNQGFKSLMPDHERTDTKFLYWWLRLHRPMLESLGNGATFKEISKRTTAAVPIHLPPIEEQRRIAAVLDAADALRAKRREALAKLDALTQAVFIDIFGSPGANRHNHPMSPLIELIDPARPITYGILKPGDDMDGGVPYVRVVDMVDGGVDPSNLKLTTPEISEQYRRSVLAAGDILLSIRGHVGRLAMVPVELAGANITQDTARLAIAGAEPGYVLEHIRTVEMQRWMANFTKGAAVRGINLTDVKKMPILIPPREQQVTFVRLADRVQAQRSRILSSCAQQRTLFSSLRQRAFRGEL